MTPAPKTDVIYSLSDSALPPLTAEDAVELKFVS